jgi:hypothetical protein
MARVFGWRRPAMPSQVGTNLTPTPMERAMADLRDQAAQWRTGDRRRGKPFAQRYRDQAQRVARAVRAPEEPARIPQSVLVSLPVAFLIGGQAAPDASLLRDEETGQLLLRPAGGAEPVPLRFAGTVYRSAGSPEPHFSVDVDGGIATFVVPRSEGTVFAAESQPDPLYQWYRSQLQQPAADGRPGGRDGEQDGGV